MADMGSLSSLPHEVKLTLSNATHTMAAAANKNFFIFMIVLDLNKKLIVCLLNCL
jgi:hypothetical protein